MSNERVYNIKINGIQENVQGVKNLNDTTTDYSRAVREANKEIKTLQGQMLELDKGSEQFKKLAKEAGDLKDKVNDAREAINRYASDTKVFDDVINLAQSTTAAFTLAKGAMSAFGMETEGAVEALQKLQGAMAVIQSLQTLQNTLKGSTATATLFTKAMNLLSLAMGKGTTASKALRLAMLSIPIMLIISLVATLIAHWEDIVGWFDKTFPVLNKVGGAMNGLKAIVKGLGQAVLNWLVNPWETFANVMKKIFSGDFAGALQAVQDGIKKQFQGTVDAFNNGFKKQVEVGLDEIKMKAMKNANEQTEYELKMLIARKGNEAKYSKEGIALQKKAFEQRKKLAKGNDKELKQIALDEANFYRECQESKSAAAKKAVDEAAKAAREAAKERADADKKAEEEAKKAAEYKAKADEAFYRSTLEYLIKQQERLVKYYEAEVKLYSAGPVDKYKEAVKKVNEETEKLVTLQRQLHLYDFFKDYKENIDESATSLDNFMSNMNVLVDQLKLFGDNVSVEEFGLFAKQLSMFSNLTEDQLKYLYHIFIDYLKDGLTKAEKTTADIKKVQEEQLKKEVEEIEKTTLKYELSEDKKSEATQALVQQLNTQWDNYLEHVKQVYGKDSKEYLEAQKKKKQDSVVGDKPKKGGNQFMDFDNNGGVDWGGIKKDIEDAYDAFVDPIVGGLTDTISMMLDFAIEEAEEALDEATEIHDKALEKVEKSKDRISEINGEMANASASQLERLKEQQADEMTLLAQREAEEKRAEREKERREQELEKKKKQQRKLELKAQIVQAMVSGALAAVNGFATQPFVPVGLAMGALATTLTAVQIAMMTKQLSKLADGGVLGGRLHSEGGNKIPSMGVEVERGEAVINRRSTAKYLPLLDAINAEGNGGKHTLMKQRQNVMTKYESGGVLNAQRISQNLDTENLSRVVQASIQSIDMHPVVSVVDINRGQKNLASVRQMAGASK